MAPHRSSPAEKPPGLAYKLVNCAVHGDEPRVERHGATDHDANALSRRHAKSRYQTKPWNSYATNFGTAPDGQRKSAGAPRRFFSRSASNHAPAAKRSAVWRMYRGCYVRYNSPYRGRARPHIPPPWRSARLFLARYYLMYKVGMCALQRGRREDGHGHWRRAPWAAKAFREAVEARSSPRGRGLRPGPTSCPYTPECVEEAFSEVRG
jgi:hypothetical protein